MLDLVIDSDETKNTTSIECKGLVYRAEVSTYQTTKGFAQTIRLNLLKSKSCTGCDKCGWLEENLNESISGNIPIVGLESVEDKKLYTLKITNCSRDWETGYIDDWDLELVEIEEVKNEL